jgi:mono/diheme cytochrome c family protein
MRAAKLILVCAVAVGGISFAGCHESDIDPMMRQEKFKAYWASDFYSDGRAMRTPPANTIPRERTLDLTPPPVTAALLKRGHERFDIHCAVCHGYAGDGDSIVASKMSLRAPPSLIDDKVRAYTVQQIFTVATEGYGYMPTYAAEVSVQDRWAIANYIKALQLSQHASLDDVPADKRGELDKPETTEPEQHVKPESHSENKE